MSYRCEKCQKTTPNDQPCNRVVTATRPKTYYSEEDERGYRRMVGAGFETVSEKVLCAKCHKKFLKENENESDN